MYAAKAFIFKSILFVHQDVQLVIRMTCYPNCASGRRPRPPLCSSRLNYINNTAAIDSVDRSRNALFEAD